jgi:hypothetical protein
VALTRRAPLAAILLCLAVNAFMAPAVVAAAPPPKKLVLLGVVTKIFQVGASTPSLRRWGATIQVERVIEGQFSQSTFTFTLHSPARAGLETGHRYIITAKWVGGGYLVDEPGGIKNADGKRQGLVELPSS